MRIPYYSNLKQYLPSFYSDVLETKVLTNVEDKLYQESVDVFNLVQDNQFVVSMDSNFISNMEKMLNINSTSEEGLEFRRARVLNRINNKPPFNLKYLIDKLDNIYGKNNYLLKINGLSTNQSIIEAFSDSEDGEGFTLDLKNSKYIGRIINDVPSYKFYKTPPTKGYRKGDLWAWEGEDFPGRNLLIGSNRRNWANASYFIREGASWRGWFAKVEPNTTYSLSRTDISNSRFRLYWLDAEPYVGMSLSDLEQNYDTKLMVEGIVSGGTTKYVFLYLSNNGDINNNIKFEKGNKATPWSPAPEDLTNGQSSGYFIATKDNDMMDFNDWRYITKEDFEWKELSESYEDDYTIELESASLNSLWYREGFNTIMTIKPSNMEYIHKPLLFDNVVVEEGLSRATGERFTLGYSKLGSPLLKIGEYEEVNIL